MTKNKPKNGGFKMMNKITRALTLMAVMATATLAQGVLTVSKGRDDPESGAFSSIQKAIDAAKPGQVIEIRDDGVYEEQITIRTGKEGLTIRSLNPASRTKPTIKWQDVTNRSPRTKAEVNDPVKKEGYSECAAVRILDVKDITIDGVFIDGVVSTPFSNPDVWDGGYPLFHGNAGLSIVRSGGVIIRNCDIRNSYFGIYIFDRNPGGVFGNKNPNDKDKIIPLANFGAAGGHLIEHNRIHDNAVGLFFEICWDLGTTVRNNLIFNNFHRSTRNLVATSKETGYTINAKGELPENNSNTLEGNGTNGFHERGNQVSGAFLFKDMLYAPIAIYNNTFHNNTGNFFANWKVGAPHLIFNNIYGVPYSYGGNEKPGYMYMSMDKFFPNRMNNCLFSAIERLQVQGEHINSCNNLLPPNNQPPPGEQRIDGQSINVVKEVEILNNFPRPTSGSMTVQCLPPISDKSATTTAVAPGAIISGTAGGVTFRAESELRWLETTKRSGQAAAVTEDLFESVDPASPNFLVPKWSHALVTGFIKNKGWGNTATGAGAANTPAMRNSDGGFADIGAIPSSGSRLQTVVRVIPENVVIIRGTTATASFRVTVENKAAFNSPKIRFLRWIAPLPVGNDDWWSTNDGNGCTPVPLGSINNIASTASVSVGVNTITFPVNTLPAGTNVTNYYGFFEIVVEGTDAAGRVVTSDVGFLPYRFLERELVIEVLGANGQPITEKTADGVPVIVAGNPATLSVKAVTGRNPDVTYNTPLESVVYKLSVPDNPTAKMYSNCNMSTPLILDQDAKLGPQAKQYPVCFTSAGDVVIQGIGAREESGSYLTFIGIGQVKVRPGVPDHVAFVNPVPKAQWQGVTDRAPDVINRNVDHPVIVEVRDQYNNAVDVATSVSIVSMHPNIGDVGMNYPALTPKQGMTDPKTGQVTFSASVVDGQTGQEFDMTATLAATGKTDVGTLRVGKVTDALIIFYSDNAPGDSWRDYYDNSVAIEENTGTWVEVTVKAVSGASVITDKKGCIKVEGSEGLRFSNSPLGVSADSKLDVLMTNGVGTFYVSAFENVADGSITVVGYKEGCSALDASIGDGFRGDITFKKPITSIEWAKVFADGFGRPDSVVIEFVGLMGGGFLDGSAIKPDSVAIVWPSATPLTPVRRVVGKSSITAVDTNTLSIDFKSVSAEFPTGVTSIDGRGWGTVVVYGALDAANVDKDFDVLDGMGPVISSKDTSYAELNDRHCPTKGSPLYMENPNVGTVDDTLLVWISEDIFEDTQLQGPSLLVYSGATRPTATTPGNVVGVKYAEYSTAEGRRGSYMLVIAKEEATKVKNGDWIKFNPAHVGKITDLVRPANSPRADNRWVQVNLMERPPEIEEVWYTSDITTGGVDAAYARFSKKADLAKWFDNGYVSVKLGSLSDSLGTSAVGSDAASLLSLENDTTVRVNFKKFPGFNTPTTRIITSGSLELKFGYNPVTAWPSKQFSQGRDEAKPVLADTVLLKFGAVRTDGVLEPDTLFVTYSEKMNPRVEGGVGFINQPVVIKSGSTEHKPTFTGVVGGTSTPVSGYGSWVGVAYLIDPSWSDANINNLNAGDLVHIDPASGVYDAAGNGIEPGDGNNLRQPLKIVSSFDLRVKPKKNPFRGGETISILVDPGTRSSNVVMTYTARIYDNMGNVVWEEKGIDVKVAGEGHTVKWDGRNKKGRMAGTGAYLFKVSCQISISGSGERHSEVRTKTIGFVR